MKNKIELLEYNGCKFGYHVNYMIVLDIQLKLVETWKK